MGRNDTQIPPLRSPNLRPIHDCNERLHRRRENPDRQPRSDVALLRFAPAAQFRRFDHRRVARPEELQDEGGKGRGGPREKGEKGRPVERHARAFEAQRAVHAAVDAGRRVLREFLRVQPEVLRREDDAFRVGCVGKI